MRAVSEREKRVNDRLDKVCKKMDYVGKWQQYEDGDNSLCLDGHFSVEELKSIIQCIEGETAAGV